MKIFPSLMPTDLHRVKNIIKQLEPYCAGFHLDVMDGEFVSNTAWDIHAINAIRHMTNKQLWIHMMVVNPEKYTHLMVYKQDIISLHYESFCTKSCNPVKLPPAQKVIDPEYIKGCQESFVALQRILPIVRANGLRTSLTLNPLTPVGVIQPLINLLDHVVLMSVEPGFAGQTFLPQTWGRLDELVNIKTIAHAPFTMGVDGGVTKAILKKLTKYKDIESVAVGSAIFKTADPVATLKKLIS